MKSKKPSPNKGRTAPGRPKDNAKRQDIVRAATALFMKEGYELTSMEAVARKADVSKLTIYSHFADKNELFRAVIQNRCNKLAVPPEGFMSLTALPVEEALTKIGMNFATLILSEDSIRLQRVIHAEAAHHSQAVKIFYEAGPRRVREAFCDLLEEFVRQKQLFIDDIPYATEQFFSLIKGERMMKVMLFLASRPNAREIADHVGATIRMFFATYGSPQTGAR